MMGSTRALLELRRGEWTSGGAAATGGPVGGAAAAGLYLANTSPQRRHTDPEGCWNPHFGQETVASPGI
jgi:hypothetical protein